MNITLRKVLNKNDIDLFVKYKISLIKLHQDYANKLGIVDKVVLQYNESDAIKHIGKRNFYQFIINYNNEDVGIVEYKTEKSEIDNMKIVYIKNIYIKDEYRNLGIGKEVLLKIKKQVNSRIELECWYGMPANNLYKSLGMNEIKTRYIWNNTID